MPLFFCFGRKGWRVPLGMRQGLSEAFRNFRPPRTLHLIDIENLVSGDEMNIRYDPIRFTLRQYPIDVPVFPGDIVVIGIAAQHSQMLRNISDQIGCLRSPIGAAVPFHIVLGRNRPDGADEALVEELELVRHATPPLTDNYRYAAFASGDGYFVESAKSLSDEGVDITNVLGEGSRAGAWNTLPCTVLYLKKYQPRRLGA